MIQFKTAKPWGWEILWAKTPKYAGKLLFVRKGHRLSLQFHRKKQETIYVLRGKLQLQIGAESATAVAVIGPGKSHYIPAQTPHRFEAPFGNVTLMEVSTPELHDVVRLQDDYGRAPNAQTKPNLTNR